MKKIALINDLSGFGKCSLTAAIPVISAMGIQACPLPTAILSAQTGFDHFYYDDYTDRMNQIADEWKRMEVSFDGIYSGYLGSAKQMENMLYFLECFHRENTIFLADPVMGDNGRCIKSFSGELLQTMKELTGRADVITPNLTELCLLAGVEYEKMISHSKEADYLSRITDAARTYMSHSDRLQTVIVTGIIRQTSPRKSIPESDGDNKLFIGNLVITPEENFFVETSYNGQSFSGTGDLFASVMIGSLVKGKSATAAVESAMTFLQPAIEEASKENMDRNHGVCFEKYLWKLLEKK